MTEPATDQPEAVQLLNNKWTMWFDNPRMADPNKEWKENLTNCGTFDTIESFWRIFNNLKPASQLDTNSNYHVFREGVVPMWEDPANKEGGKFVLTMPKEQVYSETGHSDRWWLYSALAIISETLDLNGNDVCGAVVSIRVKQDRIDLWLKTNDKERRSAVRARWKKWTMLKFQEDKAVKRCMLLLMLIFLLCSVWGIILNGNEGIY
jgi:translation initiation factor 4E